MNDGADDRVHLQSTVVQNHHGQKRVQNVQAQNQDEEEKQSRTVTVYVPAFSLIALPPEAFPSTPDGKPAQSIGGMASTVD
jgi:hypothetical protein